MWIYVAIAVGMDKAGTESPFMIVQGAGTYGSEDTTENEMIGYANGRIHEMTALLVRRARFGKTASGKHTRRLQIFIRRTGEE